MTFGIQGSFMVHKVCDDAGFFLARSLFVGWIVTGFFYFHFSLRDAAY